MFKLDMMLKVVNSMPEEKKQVLFFERRNLVGHFFHHLVLRQKEVLFFM
jgi:hypothetical protein